MTTKTDEEYDKLRSADEAYKITLKELVEVAEKYQVYLCPLSVWNETIKTIEYIRRDNKRLTAANIRLRTELKEIKERR